MIPTYPFKNAAYSTWKNAYDELEIVTYDGKHFVQQPDDSLPTEGTWYFHFKKNELYRITWTDDDTLEYIDHQTNTPQTETLENWEADLNKEHLYPVELTKSC